MERKKMKMIPTLFALAFVFFILNGCGILDDDWLLIEEEEPTKTRLEGVWAVSEAFNEAGDTITDSISTPVAAFHFSSDRTVTASAVPMIMYLVYGGSKYTQIASQIDQYFNYAGLDFNGGEYFISGGVVDRFTLEMKLEGLPGQKSLTDLLGMLGIGDAYLDVIIYHKFRDVKIEFDDDSTMVWTFDDSTSAVYNTKNEYGEYVLWEGWPAASFSHCQFVFDRKAQDLEDVILEVSNP